MPESDPSPLTAARGAARADALAVALVLAVAGLAASFVARNSDLWLHLAAGRLVAQGDYRFGTDPFADAERYWANHAWLWDWGAYLAFATLGGAALVALKAAAAVGTAALMFAATRPRGPLWLCAGCALLGAVAMAPRLLLQPAVASYLLLAACLACLATGRRLAAVPVLVAVWANVDSWFVLGPALVLLFWVGRRLAPERAALPPWPAWLVPAALVAWVLNPHHVFALQPPMELAAWGTDLAADPRFAGVFASPWRWGQFGEAGGYSPAAWAHAALLVLGAASFAANRAAVRSWRGPVWLAFAVLGAWQARLVPFFAVVGAPVCAANLCEVWPGVALARPGRALVLAAASALAALAWYGWLTGVHTRERGAAWAVHSDPGLERAALDLKEWRAAHPGGRALVTHPDLAHYVAWHAPEARGFVDARLHLFAGRATAFAAHSRALGLLPDATDDDRAGLAVAFEAVLLYDPDGGRMTRALAGSGWELARVSGAAALLVPPGAGARYDAPGEAFGGGGTLPVAGGGPPSLEGPNGSGPVRERGRGGSWPADAATVYLRAAESDRGDPTALGLLAVRAARVGIETDPNDPLAWAALGRAYLALGSRGIERDAGAALSPLVHMRFVQATGALARAVALNPDLGAAHDALARLYARRNVLDLAHRHARRVADLVRRTGRGPGEPAETFAARAEQTEQTADALEATLVEAENRYLIRTSGRAGDPLAKARAAVELGLVERAVGVLLAAHPDLYGGDGLRLLADLLLQTGRFAECRALLDRAELLRNPDALGYYELPRRGRTPYRFRAYDWLDACQRAAAGNYPEAGAALERLAGRALAEEEQARRALGRGGATFLAGEVGLAAPPRPVLARLAGAPELLALTDLLGRAVELGATRGDLLTVAGALELERGSPAAARERFRAALGAFAPVRESGLPVPGEPLAARYHDVLRGRP